mgnify:FL=1
MRPVIIAWILLVANVTAQASFNVTISGGYDTNPQELEVAQASPYLDLSASIRHSFGSWQNSFKKVQVYLNTALYSEIPDHKSSYGSFRFERRPARDYRQKLTVGASFAQNNYLSWGDTSPYYDSAAVNCSWEKIIPPFTPTFGISHSKYTYKEPFASLNQAITRPFIGLTYAKKPWNLYLEYNLGKVSYTDSSISKPSLTIKLIENKSAAGWQLAGRKNIDGNELWGNLWREVGEIHLDLALGQQSRRGNSTGYQYDSLWGETSLWLPVWRGWLTGDLSLTSTTYLATPSWEREGVIGVGYQRTVANYLAELSFSYSYRRGAGVDAAPGSSGSRLELSIRR